MRDLRFGHGLAFAAVAALGVPAAMALLSPWIGAANALALYLVSTAAAYLATIAPTLRRRAGSAIVVIGLGCALWLALPGRAGTPLVALAMGCAVIVAVGRSFARPQRPARALAVEIALGACGLALAGLLFAPGSLGVAAALWGYWLVQSGYSLVPRPAAGYPGSGADDAFERAAARLDRMLTGV